MFDPTLELSFISNTSRQEKVVEGFFHYWQDCKNKMEMSPNLFKPFLVVEIKIYWLN